MNYPKVTAKHAKQALRDSGENFHGRPKRITRRGQSSSIFLIEGNPRIIVKIQTCPERFENIIRESSVLRLLENHSWCPRIIAEGVIVGIGHYVIQERMLGIPLSEVWLKLTEEDRLKAGKALGNILCQLHEATSFEECGDFLSDYPTVESFLLARFRKISHDLEVATENQPDNKKEVRDILREVESFIDEKVGRQESKPPYNLIHNDFHFGNVLYDPKRRRVVGIVDFELAQKSLPLLELLRLYYSVNWPRRFVYSNQHLREAYRNIRLSSLWRGVQEAYPSIFESTETNPYLLCASAIYDLEALAKSIKNNWVRSTRDNLNRLNYTTVHHKLYSGLGWI